MVGDGAMGVDDELPARLGRVQGDLGRLEGLVMAHIDMCTEERGDNRERMLRMDENIISMRRTMDSASGSWKMVVGIAGFAAMIGAGAAKIGAVFAALVR